jgi:peptidoglycan/xylan/chitin deacetylase (PgdA/CDA1 family)
MGYLHDNGYHIVTMAQAQEMLAKNQIPAKTAVITFDDGYVSFYNRAWPILKEYGFPATVYVITNFVVIPNYMSWDQITSVQKAGIEIGSHTLSHPSLITLDPNQMAKEIRGSKEILESTLGVPIQSFCYPGGDYNQQVVQIVKEAGYTSAVTIIPRLAAASDNQYLLPRIRVPGWASLSVFAKGLK